MAQTGANPLVSNAGTLPATLAVGGSDYTCQFDAQICGQVGSISTSTGTCSGIQVTDSVSATLTGDENETVTQTIVPAAGLTVKECITPQ
jgi:hypothetical protein